jgi:Putative Flp pilus-assembly TadE/G-like
MTSLVIDGGSWYRTQRHLQTAADAAALAGAQDISENITNQGGARATAVEYGTRNDIAIDPAEVTFPSVAEIDVKAGEPVSGMFMPALKATAGAHARAQVSVPLNMKNIAPIAVKTSAACFISNPSCFGQTVTVDLNESQISSNLDGWINLDCHNASLGACGSGGTGGGELKDWISTGYPGALPSNQWYGVKTGGTNGVKETLDKAAGKTLLIPVWDQESLSPASFHIIGWAAFVIQPGGVDFKGQSKELTGHFVTFLTTDLAAGNPIGGADDFGVHVITLTQ